MFLWKVSRNKRKGTIKKKAVLSVLGLYFVGGKVGGKWKTRGWEDYRRLERRGWEAIFSGWREVRKTQKLFNIL